MAASIDERRSALLALLDSPTMQSAVSLAERVGAVPSTVRRDVRALRAAGHPIQSRPGVGYSLRPSAPRPVKTARRSMGARREAVLDLLAEADGPVSAAALGAAIDASPRTIYRYVDTLRALGAVIDGERGVGLVLVRRPPRGVVGRHRQARRREQVLAMLRRARVDRALLTATDLAHRLDVSERTVLRDLATLRQIGHDVRVEAGVGCMLGAPSLRPLHLTIDEAIELRHVAAGALEDAEGARARRVLRRACSKLDALLPSDAPDFDYDDIGAGAA